MSYEGIGSGDGEVREGTANRIDEQSRDARNEGHSFGDVSHSSELFCAELCFSEEIIGTLLAIIGSLRDAPP